MTCFVCGQKVKDYEWCINSEGKKRPRHKNCEVLKAKAGDIKLKPLNVKKYKKHTKGDISDIIDNNTVGDIND